MYVRGPGSAVWWLAAALTLAGCAGSRAQLQATSAKKRPAASATSPRATSQASERCRDLLPLIEKAAEEGRIEPALLVGIVRTESNFRADARSPVGAQGLTQVMPATGRAKKCGNLDDPEENLRCGARVLASFLEHYRGDLYLGLSGYNAGHAMPDKARKETRVPRNFQYVEDVLRARARYLRFGCEAFD